MQKYEPVIGLEIHVQLKTKSKMFSTCPVPADGAPPNTVIDPLTMGHPGTLPVANEEAIRYTVMASRALGCDINQRSHFDRKSYFYPDLPKGYQISQYDKPFGHDGHLLIQYGKTRRRIRIERVHLEEDTGKLLHDKDKTASYVDYNRAGTPLMEIVTHPDLQTPEGAKFFLHELRLIMRYLGISDADMEKGQLRCDANISLRPNPSYFTDKAEQASMGLDPNKLYPKTEIKNLNSFKAVEKALEYEIKRQTNLWDEDKAPTIQSTRGWDEKKGETFAQREKEEQHDYRYFPDPDLPPVELSDEFVQSAEQAMPELPQQKRERFGEQFGLGEYDINILVAEKALANYFEAVVSELKSWLLSEEQVEGSEEEIWQHHGKKLVKTAANWIISRLLTHIKPGMPFTDLKITPENFAELLTLLYKKRLNNQTAVVVLEKMFTTGGDPSDIMEEEDLSQMSSDDGLDDIITKVLADNPDQVAQFKDGKEAVLQYLIGQVMKATKGKADAQEVGELLKKAIN